MIVPTNSEQDRIFRIRKRLNFNPVEHLVEGYEAVAVHSNSIMIDADQGCADMFGYSREEIICLNAWVFFPTESARIIAEKLATHCEDPYQVMAKHKDGSLFKVEIKGKEFSFEGDVLRTVLLKKVLG